MFQITHLEMTNIINRRGLIGLIKVSLTIQIYNNI